MIHTRKYTLSLLFLVVFSTLLLASQQAAAQTNTPVQQEGILSIIHFDPAPGSGLEYYADVTLSDDAGHTALLLMPVGEALSYQAQRVYVSGQRVNLPADAAGYDDAIQVDSIGLAAAVISPAGVNEPFITGSVKYINLLCRFADSTGGAPQLPSFFDGLMGEAYPGVNHFWDEVSYGNVNLDGTTTVSQWYTMVGNEADYRIGSTMLYSDIAQACVNAADAAVNFTQYEGVNFFFDWELGYALGGGVNVLTSDTTGAIFLRSTWNPRNLFNQTFVAHEVGHSIGLPHSAGNPVNSRYPYDSYWDVMSGGGDNLKVWDPIYESVAPATIAYHMDLLDWIPANRKIVVNQGASAIVTLEHLYLPQSTTNALMVEVLTGDPTLYYTVEARQLTGYDDALPDEGVLINSIDLSRSEPANIVDGDAISAPSVNDAGGIWKVGETYTNASANLTIRVLSQSGSAYTVYISNNGANPTPSAADDTYLAQEDTLLTVNAANGVLANDTNPVGTLTAMTMTNPTNGTLTFGADGAFTYLPDSGFRGLDSFTYKATNQVAETNVATVTINTNMPAAVADSYSTLQGTTLNVSAVQGVLANDVNKGSTPTAVLVAAPGMGNLTLNPDGSFAYVPAAGTYTTSFTYKLNDGILDSNPATVTITVLPLPVAVNDSYTTNAGNTLIVNAAQGVLANDTNTSVTPVAAKVSDPTNGTLNFNTDGSFYYIPNVGFAGSDSFTYQFNNGAADSNVAAVSITVAVNLSNNPGDLGITGTMSAPVIPTFRWSHASAASPTTASGNWYNVKVTKNSSTVIDQWFPVEQVCIGVTCSVSPGIELYETGTYQWTVSVWTWTNEAALQGSITGISTTASFVVNLGNVALPQNITINASLGRPSVSFRNDNNTAWLNIYVGSANGSQLVDFRWYRKDQAQCDADLCTLLLDAHPLTNGSYALYMQAWGPAGFSQGGPFASIGAPGWTGAQNFVVNTPAPAMLSGVTVTDADTGRPTFAFKAVGGATWYYVEINQSENPVAWGWYPAAETGCPAPGDLCIITPNAVLQNNGSFQWRVAGWGPGVGSGSLQYNGGSFSVNASNPTAPALIGFTSTVTTSRPTFHWNKVEDASWYEVIVKRGNTPVFDNWYPLEYVGCHVSDTCALVLPDVYLSNGNYTWTVRAYTPANLGNLASEQALTIARP